MNPYINKAIKTLWAFTFLALLNSCQVLDTVPELEIGEESSITDKKSAEAALIGAYNSLGANSYQGVTFRSLVNLTGDNLRWVGNSPANREFDVHQIFATNSRVEDLWSAIYKTINITNNIIAAVPLANDQTFSQADKDRILGEAHFIRALAYFDLVRLWNNVPILTETTKNASSGEGITNSASAEVYALIENDLNAAETLLPVTLQRNRANAFTAKALKARLYLYLQNWDKAESYASEVINQNAFFSLVKPYNRFYLEKNTPESIFEIDYTINNRNNYAINWLPGSLGGRREWLPSDDLISSLKDPAIGGDRSALLLDVNTPQGVVTYGNMNFKVATGEDQVYVLRLAEMYLTRAEARAELNNFTGAIEDINLIRERANALPVADTQDKNILIKTILAERRLELAFESHRWFDLVRRGEAQEVLQIPDANRLVFPIPRQQLLIDKDLVQNPGY
jgi:tetratricopeptide (TPR) repeat protein